jgi:hypothetical protein
VTNKKEKRRRKNKTSQSPEETVNMINTIWSEYDHLPLHHSLRRRMILAYQQSSVLLVRRSLTRLSATLDRVST